MNEYYVRVQEVRLVRVVYLFRQGPSLQEHYRCAGSLWRGVWYVVLGRQPWRPVGGRLATIHRYPQAQELLAEHRLFVVH